MRRDIFNRFRDATSLRASLLGDVGAGFQLTGAYAEGIAQPTFFDLYGFFPGNFVGNPGLKAKARVGGKPGALPEWPFSASLTGYRQRLYDEILDVGDPVTFLRTTINLDQVSHRSGIEAEAAWRLGDKLRLTANYAYLHATEPDAASGLPVTEHRRPKHSGAIVADGAVGKWSYGASIAYVGSQLDTRDNFPYDVVRLGSYWLAGARVAYAVRPGIELFARGSNLFDGKYENSVGYRTEGGLAGIRLAGRKGSGGRVRDHRGEFAFGRDFAVEQGPPGELADAGPLLEELDFEPEEDARLDRLPELHVVDRHEINELAGAGEAERLDREHACGLRQRFDLKHAGHDRPSREMPLEELLVHRHRLDRDDALFRIEAFDPVDQQHRIAMRQRRHHPLDVERADGGACRLVGQRLAALRLLLSRRRRSSRGDADGSATFSAAVRPR